MSKSLTNSDIRRQNILNNNTAIIEIQKATGIKGLLFENQYRLLNEQVATFFEVETRTIRRYLNKYSDELKNNGYEILKNNRLRDFKNQFGLDNNINPKTPKLGVFNFKSFLNLSMLLVESDKARVLRSTILDIAIDTINQKTGGSTKYINQREENFIIQYFKGEFYKKEFITALKECVNLGFIKYPIYIDKIYHNIFKEKADEYRNLLKLTDEEDERQTMYAEVLLIISGFEYALAIEIEKTSKNLNRKLEYNEVDEILDNLVNQPFQKPFIEDARRKMASYDYGFKNITHEKIRNYIAPIPTDDFEKFIGQKSKTLEEWLEISSDVLKRLKERK